MNPNFRLSWWLVIDVNLVLGLLHRVDVGDDAGVSAVYSYAASFFKISTDPEDGSSRYF
jgi:hypothetical protein